MTKRGFPAAALTLLLLAGCAVTPTPFDRSQTGVIDTEGLTGITWLLDTLGEEPVLSETFPSVTFNDQGGLNGSGGCNVYSGSFTINGTQIYVDESLVSTMMACDESVMAQESSFFNALLKASSFAIADDTLSLTSESGRTLATFSAQSQNLAETSWVVTAFNNGQQAVVSVLDETTPTIEFTSETEVTGRTGCNQISGTVVTAGETISFDEFTATEMACPDIAGAMEQDAQIQAALLSAATYHVEANRLEMRTADDQLAIQLVRV